MGKDFHQAKRLAFALEARTAELATYKPVFPVGAPLSAGPPSVDDIPVKAEDSGEVKEEDLDAACGPKPWRKESIKLHLRHLTQMRMEILTGRNM